MKFHILSKTLVLSTFYGKCGNNDNDKTFNVTINSV